MRSCRFLAAGEEIRLADLAGGDRVLERADDRFLPDDLFEVLRAVLAVERSHRSDLRRRAWSGDRAGEPLRGCSGEEGRRLVSWGHDAPAVARSQALEVRRGDADALQATVGAALAEEVEALRWSPNVPFISQIRSFTLRIWFLLRCSIRKLTPLAGKPDRSVYQIKTGLSIFGLHSGP